MNISKRANWRAPRWPRQPGSYAGSTAGTGHRCCRPRRPTYKASALPGFELVQRNCMACHAAQYVSTQPPASARPYWEATVKKMKKPFGAQFDERDIAPMVDYLVKTYGAERNTAAAGAPAAGSPAAR